MTAIPARVNGTEPAGGVRGGRVIVGIDDSPGGLAALRWAVELARSRRASLVAVRAWGLGLPRHGGRRHRGYGRGNVVLAFRGAEPRQAATELTRRAFRAATGGAPEDLDVTIETPEGDPGLVLTTAASAGTDVLVVGTAPRGGLKRMVHGSVGAYCPRHSRCPVAVIEAGVHAGIPGTPGQFRLTTSPVAPAAGRTGEVIAMRAHVGDRLVVGTDRVGMVIGVPAKDGSPPYIVKWLKDGHIAMVSPDQYSRIIPSGDTASTDAGSTQASRAGDKI